MTRFSSFAKRSAPETRLLIVALTNWHELRASEFRRMPVRCGCAPDRDVWTSPFFAFDFDLPL